jgi:transcriptional regulator with XRE-family HTH domain
MDTSALKRPKPSQLSEAVGISVPYASQILKGRRVPPQAMALRIYRATGWKTGPIADATEEDIEVLERFQGAA